MPFSGAEPVEAVAWARRVNNRWIVHHGLRESAEAYLTHLATTDPERGVRSSRRAQKLVHTCRAGEDPKPWFYAGLFSLATVEEAGRFLSGHWFTAACLPARRAVPGEPLQSRGLGPNTQAKIEAIREAVAGLANGD